MDSRIPTSNISVLDMNVVGVAAREIPIGAHSVIWEKGFDPACGLHIAHGSSFLPKRVAYMPSSLLHSSTTCSTLPDLNSLPFSSHLVTSSLSFSLIPFPLPSCPFDFRHNTSERP